MAEELFNYPAAPPSQNSSSSPRPKTSRESTRKRKRKHHHSSTENKDIQNEKENQEQEEDQQQKQRSCDRPLLPSINKDENSRSPRDNKQTDSYYKSEVFGTNNAQSLNKYSNQTNNDNFEEEEIDEILYWTQKGMKNPSILEDCNTDLLPTVIVNLKDLRDQYLVNDEVDESCAADVALTEARKIHKKNLMHLATKSMRDDLEARLQEAEDALKELEETCEYQEDRMNREMAKESSDLIIRHKEETQKLIAAWTSQPPPPSEEQLEIELGKTYSVRPATSKQKTRTSNDRKDQNIDDSGDQNYTDNKSQNGENNNGDDQEYNEDTARIFRQYNKFSPQLIYLYDQADRLLRAKRYQESKEIFKKAKDLEKIEVERNHIRMERDYNAALEALRVKQADEVAIQEKTHNDRRKEYYHARDFDMKVAQNRIEKIKKELEATENPDKVWALHHRHDFEMPKPENQSPSQTQKSIYSSRGVFETTKSSTTVGNQSVYDKFSRINLPPLKSGRSSRRVIQNTQRSFKFNKGYVFT